MIYGKLSQNIVLFVVILIINVSNHVLSYCNISINCEEDISIVNL